MPTVPRPVTKIITKKVISPLSRADMSTTKVMQVKNPPTKSTSEEPFHPEDENESKLTEELDDEVADALLEKEPILEEKQESPTTVFSTNELKTPLQQTNVDSIPTKKEEKDLESVLENVEEELAFLSSGTKIIPKTLSPEKILTPMEKEVDEIPTVKREEPNIEQVPLQEDFWEDDKKYKEVKTDITLDFNKKYESCYVDGKLHKENASANIFIREVSKESFTFHQVLQAHQFPSKGIYIVSPFKFFQKQDFVAIFQKAFLGIIFDLSYATPYYYTKDGTHHIYLSSQIIEEDKMPHVVLLDLLPQREHFYSKQNLSNNKDFIHFSIFRILLVSANVLYL